LPVDVRNKASQTGLMIACANNKSCETVKVILDQSPNICAEDLQGWTALHYAAKQGSLESAKLLVKHKAEINAKTDKNETALFLATKHNHPDIVEFLAENHCHLQAKALYKKPVKYSWDEEEDHKEKDFTALEVAVQHNFAEIAKCLLFHLIRTKELNEEELNKLLRKAAKEDHTKIAHALLINGANVNHLGGTNNSLNQFYIILLDNVELEKIEKKMYQCECNWKRKCLFSIFVKKIELKRR
jgi:ankyrin repeat protein